MYLVSKFAFCRLVNVWTYYLLISHFHPSCRPSLCSKLCASYAEQLDHGYEWRKHRLPRCCRTRQPQLRQSRCRCHWRTYSRSWSVQVDDERDCIWGCHHKRTFDWCLVFPDIRIPQHCKRAESYTYWRVGEEYLLASRRRRSSRIWRASWGYLVKQDHWSAPDGCVDEWENFGTDRCYFTGSNSHPAVLRTRLCLTN